MIEDEIICKIWEESVEYAEKQFESLPENKKLNGFYLQELMHCYVEKLGNYIINNVYEE